MNLRNLIKFCDFYAVRDDLVKYHDRDPDDVEDYMLDTLTLEGVRNDDNVLQCIKTNEDTFTNILVQSGGDSRSIISNIAKDVVGIELSVFLDHTSNRPAIKDLSLLPKGDAHALAVSLFGQLLPPKKNETTKV